MNGKLASKIIDLIQTKPGWALVFAILFLIMANGISSYGFSFWGQNSSVTATLAKLEQADRTLKSEIKSERESRIREILTLKEDGKLLSEASIRLIIIEELQKSEDRLVKRLRP